MVHLPRFPCLCKQETAGRRENEVLERWNFSLEGPCFWMSAYLNAQTPYTSAPDKNYGKSWTV